MLKRVLRSLKLLYPRYPYKMDVTKSNFDEKLLSEISDHIQGCSFMSLDCEFSGLHAEANLSPLDTLCERYAATIRPSITQFMAFQFGLSIFRPVPGGFSNQTYNFYVWQGASVPSHDARFLSQSSSIDFLASHQFDFNKLFREGLSYIRLSEAETLRQNLIDKQNTKADYAPINIPEQQKEFIKDITERISKYIEDEEKEDPLELPSSNGFQRRLIYQSIQQNFGDKVFAVTNKKRMLNVIKQKNRERFQKSELEEFDKSLGFSKVIRIMSESKKPLVGHNMMLDLCFTINQFVTPLPETYGELKTIVRATFPEIYDTKVMASIPPIKDHIPNSTLEDLRQRLKESPFKVPRLDPPLYEEGGTYHEAGFDAHVTGLCFIGMRDFLLSQVPVAKRELIMKPYADKLAVMRINDVPYLNLAGEDISPDRSHVFYVTFPAIWKTCDLNSLFSSFGNVQINWLNENSAYVSLYQKELSGSVMESLNCSSVYSIIPYAKHKSRALPTSITPLLENSEIFSSSLGSTKKRAVPPNGTPAASLKRSKSKTEQNRPAEADLFTESTNWE
eukprot:TRINITY_DN7169_c0_g1_i1.p1 TRINITY_DN7169_c0_g1~~TRINITY_DN7169_c0_g1_i1.p1  ORF type:complete len:562 (-),score=217.34 TRINITY_DN7169_c0_g1_i1:209-1894(-)